MTPYVVASATVLAAPPIVVGLARVAGLRPAPLVAARQQPHFWVGALRLALVAAALPVMLGNAGGDLILAAAAVAVGAVGRSPFLVLAALASGTVGALRVGSGAVPDVVGAHLVVGPAITSPSAPHAVAAGLIVAACVLAAAATLPAPDRGGISRTFVSPDAMTGSLLPLLFSLLAVSAALGSVLGDGHVGAGWILTRAGTCAGAVLAGAALRRAVPTPSMLAPAAAVAATIGLAVAVAVA